MIQVQSLHLEISSAKYFASEMVSRVADNALQILGGAGYMENNVITRMYRDTRLFRLYEGTSQIQQRTIARALVKKQREKVKIVFAKIYTKIKVTFNILLRLMN